MPFKPHPTDPDKLIFKANEYNLPKPWVGLSDEEIRGITGITSADSDWNVNIVMEWCRAIEAKLKEKNGGH